jgi:DNA invertase Pin-like site-specific DNA recombinase
MKKYGYVRVSTQEQHEDRQMAAMEALGIPPPQIFMDKLSGKDTKRPRLKALMAIVKPGDVVIVESISRFARNTKDLLDLVDKLTKKGVDFSSQKEKIDTSTPTGKFMLTIFAAVAELERGYMLQRQAEGIVAARKRGVQFGRSPIKPPENFTEIVELWESKTLAFAEALARTGYRRSTFYSRLKEFRLIQNKQ